MKQERVIIEGLRSGVPYRETAKTVTLGRESALSSLRQVLGRIEEGHRPASWGKVIRAQYGEGKTHFLHALAAQAEDRNWLVAMVSISKETPLDRIDYLYPKIMQNIYRPGSHQPGFIPVLREALQTPRLATQSRQLMVSDRVRTVLEQLIRQDHGFEELLEDVNGQFLTLAQIKRIARDNLGKPIKLASSRIKDEIGDYLRLVDWLIGQTAYAGLLVLFDEVELIGKFGRGGRARSYANMGQWLEGVGDRTYSVWAVASNFQPDVMTPRRDVELVPQWLLSRPQEQNKVEWARLALDELGTAKPLEPLSSPHLRTLLEQLQGLHEAAYGWQAPVSAEAFFERVRSEMPVQDARLRTWVRLGLAVLDLWFQYGDTAAISAKGLDEVDLTEEPEPLRGTDEEPEDPFADPGPHWIRHNPNL